MKEVWRDVAGYEGLYKVSNHGRVFSVPRTTTRVRVMKQSLRNRYWRVTLHKHGKQKGFSVHRLVLIAFAGRPKNGAVCRHLDGNRLNNMIDNLCWGTPAENQQDRKVHGTANIGEDNGCAKLNDSIVRKIRAATGTQRQIAKAFSISQSHVQRILSRESWGHVE